MGRYKRYEKDKQIKTEKPDIRKMMKYTVKKILWVTNYSLSFSRKDNGKEIFIKLLGCVVLLQCLSLIVSFSLNMTQIFLINPFATFGLLFLILVFIFKKEINSFSLFKKKETQREKESVYKEKCSLS